MTFHWDVWHDSSSLPTKVKFIGQGRRSEFKVTEENIPYSAKRESEIGKIIDGILWSMAYTLWVNKKEATVILPITLPHIDWFLKFFHFDLLTLVSGHTWRVTWSTPPPSLKILRLSVLQLWRFISKFATKSSLIIPPHLNCVTTLPCEISMFKEIALLKTWVYEASCHAKLSHSKPLLKFLTVILSLFRSLTKI